MHKIASQKIAHKSERKQLLSLPVSIIMIAAFLAFSPSLSNEFVNWDDYAYIVDNAILRDLSLKNILHLFDLNTHVVGNYHPLTVLTNMIEFKLVGTNPFLYHFDNLILHLLNVLLVCMIVFSLTSRYWATVIATALFAVHPMRVESVVWAAERKDVLYTLFFLLAMYQYVKYVKSDRKPLYRYFATLVFFLLSILSKGQAVVLPLVLLLIDFWADRKFDKKTILEKIPFFVLSVIFGLLATKAQASSFTEERMIHYAFTDRIFFASYNLLAYPFKMIFPFNLACFYGYPAKAEMMLYYLALPAVLLLIAFICWKYRKNKPVMFGILFFLFTISVVIQLLPIGNAIIADRYTYVPYFGLFFMVGVLSDKIMLNRPKLTSTVTMISFVVFIVFILKSFAQSRTWNNSETLWLQALKVNEKEPLANNNLAAFYLGQNEPEKALPLLETCVANSETYLEVYKAYNNLGGAYKDLKQYDKSIEAYTKSLEVMKIFPDALFNRGLAYTDMQRYNESIKDFTTLLSRDSLNTNAYYSRAIAFKGKGDLQNAIADYKKIIKLNPQYIAAYVNLGNIYFSRNEYNEAIACYTDGINISPDGGGYINRSKAYFMSGNYPAALSDYKNAVSYGASEPGLLEAINAKMNR